MHDYFKEHKILTVSVASYNVENTLRQTLDSFCDERYMDYIEVLIEDDGSSDSTQEIGKEYENNYPNTFRYIMKENGGHGSTINKSISLAKGLYFKVVDGDDWVDKDSFNEFINLLIDNKDKHSPDLVLTKYAEVIDNTDKVKPVQLYQGVKPGYLYNINEIDSLVETTIHAITVKTDILKQGHAKITEKCYYVDVEYIMWCIYLCNTVTFFDITPYMYRVANENQSISKNSLIKNIKMQERVSISTSTLYHSWFENENNKKKDNNIGKEKACLAIICHVVGATIRTYMLMTNTKDALYKTRKLEKKIKTIDHNLYKKLNQNIFFRIINIGNNCMFPLVRYIYRRKWKY